MTKGFSELTEEELAHRRSLFVAKMYTDIEREGQSLIGVFIDDGKPPFTYTVGMSKVGLPEFLVFSLGHELAGGILNGLCDTARAKKAAGLPVGPGYFRDIFVGFDGALIAANRAQARWYVVQAVNMYGPGIDVLQLVFPDESGFFPWDPGYALPAELQPVLGDPPALEEN